MARASWKGATIAESDDVEVVEGNVYFPPDALNMEHLQPSTHETVCGWKGTAGYYDVVVDGQVNTNAAWYYAAPKPAAKNIAGHVAFWRGIEVER